MKLGMRRRLARAAGLLLVAGGVAVLPTSPAAAEVPVAAIDVSDVNAYEAISGKNGDVTAAGCSTAAGTVGTKTIAPNGDTVGTTPIVPGPPFDRAAIYLCDSAQAIGEDGTLYGVEALTYPTELVVAYEPDGSKLWSTTLSVPGCSSDLGVGNIRMGSDGNIYVVGMPWFGQCSNNPSLYSFTPGGTLRWQVVLTGGQLVTFMNTYSQNGGGVVLLAGYNVLYYDYDGQQVATVATDGGYPMAHASHANGTLVVSMYGYQNPPACEWDSSKQVLTHVQYYTVSGKTMDYAPPCTTANRLLMAANGDVVFSADKYDGVARIVRLHYDPNNDTTSEHEVLVMPAIMGDRTFYGSGMNITPETNGNILTQRLYKRENGKYWGSEFRLINVLDGSSTMAFYTDVIDDEQSIMVQEEAVALTSGRLSFIARVCGGWTCSTLDDLKLYSLPVAELGMDYPRGTILGVAQASFDVMAVAGDSFTAGVGSLLASQTYVHQACARSPNSYGNLADLDAQVKLRMPADAFVACSGAQTHHMTVNTQVSGQGPQIGRIPSNAKAVFLTIGGNDVGFGRLGALCIFVDCTLQGYKDEFNGNLVGLNSTLASVYEAIATQAPNAHIYVLNYPHILPQEDCDNSGSAWWIALGAARLANPAVYENMAVDAGLTPAEGDVAAGAAPTITNDEITWARQFENSLNLKVSDAVDLANNEITGDDRVHLVLTTLPGSPLEGHELCSEEPYFNGLDGATSANTFHPNAAGQQAMYELARDALQDHQPQYVLAG